MCTAPPPSRLWGLRVCADWKTPPYALSFPLPRGSSAEVCIAAAGPGAGGRAEVFPFDLTIGSDIQIYDIHIAPSRDLDRTSAHRPGALPARRACAMPPAMRPSCIDARAACRLRAAGARRTSTYELFPRRHRDRRGSRASTCSRSRQRPRASAQCLIDVDLVRCGDRVDSGAVLRDHETDVEW